MSDQDLASTAISFSYLPSWVRRHFLTLAFIGGFITDLILLNQVDNLVDNLILLFYVCLSTIALLLFYASLTGKLGGQYAPRVQSAAAVAMQYAFGGLFSGMLIFYGRSSDPLASWPFLLLIVAVIAGNELLKDRGKRLVFNLTAYFVGIFSYIALVIPVFTGWIGPWVFLGSGLLALVLVFGIVQLLQLIIPHYFELQKRFIVFSVSGAFALFQGMYWSNIIPPIPLSLVELSVVHQVVPSGTNPIVYTIYYEDTPWWDLKAWWRPTLRIGNTGTAACFASVYAPARMTTSIFHYWEKYNETLGRWEKRFEIPYPIFGIAGESGYRGFSATENASIGLWRCSIKTGRGQVLGHRAFYIDTSKRTVDLTVRVD